MAKDPTQGPEQRENPFINIGANIILPVVVLNHAGKYFGERGPLIALVIALIFPLAYGLYDYVKRKKKNALSILGIVNVLITGGLALYRLEGFWFAVKEAAFPFIIGVAVYISSFTKVPFIRMVAFNDQVLQIEKIKKRLAELGHELKFAKHLANSTKLFATSFFLSSVLNFALARHVFSEIDSTLGEMEKADILNNQIADMTWMSFIVIVLPLMAFMGLVLWHLFSGIRKLTGYKFNEVIPDHHKDSLGD